MRIFTLLVGVLLFTGAAGLAAAGPTTQVLVQIRKFPGDPALLRMLGLPEAADAARTGTSVSVGEKDLFVLLNGPIPILESAQLSTQDAKPAQIVTGTRMETTTLRVLPHVQSPESATVEVWFGKESSGTPPGPPFRASRRLGIGETLGVAPEPGLIVTVTLSQIEEQPAP